MRAMIHIRFQASGTKPDEAELAPEVPGFRYADGGILVRPLFRAGSRRPFSRLLLSFCGPGRRPAAATSYY